MIMIANEHIRIGSNSYEKLRAFRYLGSLVRNKNGIEEEIKRRLKAEINFITQSKHFCLLDFSLKI